MPTSWGTGSAAVSTSLLLRPFGATTVFGPHLGSMATRRSRVAPLTATSRVAALIDVRYWRGRKRRLAGDDSWARVRVMRSWIVSTVGNEVRGTRCLVPWTISAPAPANFRPLAYRSHNAMPS